MGKPKPSEYAAALDDLERMRAAGSITPGQYEVHRERLLAEMNHRPLPLSIRIAIVLVGIVCVFILVGVVVRFMG